MITFQICLLCQQLVISHRNAISHIQLPPPPPPPLPAVTTLPYSKEDREKHSIWRMGKKGWNYNSLNLASDQKRGYIFLKQEKVKHNMIFLKKEKKKKCCNSGNLAWMLASSLFSFRSVHELKAGCASLAIVLWWLHFLTLIFQNPSEFTVWTLLQ